MDSVEKTIRKRAYDLWERAGRPEGRSEEFWFAAAEEAIQASEARYRAIVELIARLHHLHRRERDRSVRQPRDEDDPRLRSRRASWRECVQDHAGLPRVSARRLSRRLPRDWRRQDHRDWPRGGRPSKGRRHGRRGAVDRRVARRRRATLLCGRIARYQRAQARRGGAGARPDVWSPRAASRPESLTTSTIFSLCWPGTSS